jgi:hypothetical protein
LIIRWNYLLFVSNFTFMFTICRDVNLLHKFATFEISTRFTIHSTFFLCYKRSIIILLLFFILLRFSWIFSFSLSITWCGWIIVLFMDLAVNFFFLTVISEFMQSLMGSDRMTLKLFLWSQESVTIYPQLPLLDHGVGIFCVFQNWHIKWL